MEKLETYLFGPKWNLCKVWSLYYQLSSSYRNHTGQRSDRLREHDDNVGPSLGFGMRAGKEVWLAFESVYLSVCGYRQSGSLWSSVERYMTQGGDV